MKQQLILLSILVLFAVGCECEEDEPIGTFDCNTKNGRITGDIYGYYRRRCYPDEYQFCIIVQDGNVINISKNAKCNIVMKSKQPVATKIKQEQVTPSTEEKKSKPKPNDENEKEEKINKFGGSFDF